MGMFQFGHEFFGVIEDRLGPRLGKAVSTTLLILIIFAIAVFCLYLIWTDAVAPIAQVIVGLKVSVNSRDLEAAILSGVFTALLTWAVFRLLMNAWMQGTHQMIQRLNESQATAREIIRDVRATTDEAHIKVMEIFDNARKEAASLSSSWASDIQGDIRSFLDTVKQIISDLGTHFEERLNTVERRLPPDES